MSEMEALDLRSSVISLRIHDIMIRPILMIFLYISMIAYISMQTNIMTIYLRLIRHFLIYFCIAYTEVMHKYLVSCLFLRYGSRNMKNVLPLE